jgi:hypothetical protein
MLSESSTNIIVLNIMHESTAHREERERERELTTKIVYAGPAFWVLLFFPYPARNTQLELFPIPTREEKCHVPLYNEAIMAVSNFPVAVPYASWVALPSQFSTISSNFQAIGVVSSIVFITHETEECHINRSHAKLEGFKMETEVLTKTVEDLTRTIKETIAQVS